MLFRKIATFIILPLLLSSTVHAAAPLDADAQAMQDKYDQLRQTRIDLESAVEAKKIRRSQLAAAARDDWDSKLADLHARISSLRADEAASDKFIDEHSLPNGNCDVIQLQRENKPVPADMMRRHLEAIAQAKARKEAAIRERTKAENDLIVVQAAGPRSTKEELELNGEIANDEIQFTKLNTTISSLRLKMESEKVPLPALKAPVATTGAKPPLTTGSVVAKGQPGDAQSTPPASPNAPSQRPDPGSVQDPFPAATPPVDSYVGTFRNDSYSLTLQATDTGYSGTLVTPNATRQIKGVKDGSKMRFYVARNDGTILEVVTSLRNGNLVLGEGDSAINLGRAP